MKKHFIISTLLLSVILMLSVSSCNNDDDIGYLPPGEGDLNLPPLDPQLVQQGQEIFRYETFGDETFWTDVLQMNEVIESAVSPNTALAVGLKVDAEALPAAVVTAIQNGEVDLDDPQTTLTLLQLNAVVGVQGEVSQNPDGTLKLDRLGITCALRTGSRDAVRRRDSRCARTALRGSASSTRRCADGRRDGSPCTRSRRPCSSHGMRSADTAPSPHPNCAVLRS